MAILKFYDSAPITRSPLSRKPRRKHTQVSFYNPACYSLLLEEPLNHLKLTNILVLQTETKGQEVKGVLLQEAQLMKDFL